LGWPWWTYNFSSDQKALDALPEALDLNTIDPDLSAFSAHGGKLIMWVGWEDPQIFVWDTVNFYDYMIHQNAANAADRKALEIADENPEYPYHDKGSRASERNGPSAELATTVESPTTGDSLSTPLAAYTRALTNTEQFAKLYMASGVNHCGGGPGAQSFVSAPGDSGELTQALINWVESDVPPGSIEIAKQVNNSSTGATQFTTLLCPWPRSLAYKGTGNLLNSGSYSCVMPDLATITRGGAHF
jgi:feruloyl esterase